MLGIALLADRGPTTAAAVAVSLLAAAMLLPVVLPPASLLSLPLVVGSAAVVAFVILRRGERAALRAAGVCLAILVVLSLLLSGTATRVPLIAAMLWLPAILAAMVLRRFVSLDLAVLAVTACGLLTAFGIHLVIGSDAEVWRDAVALQLGDPQRTGLSEAQFDTLVDTLASRMTGATGVSVMAVALCALFLGRHWQASVMKPGGFREEFHAIALGVVPAIGCVVLIGASVLFDGSLWDALAFVAIVAFFVQGLAVAHAVVARRGLAKGWLIGLYAMLLLPHTVLLLAALGLADNVFSLRGSAAPPG